MYVVKIEKYTSTFSGVSDLVVKSFIITLFTLLRIAGNSLEGRKQNVVLASTRNITPYSLIYHKKLFQ